jgi:hypothetical protein
MKISSGLGVFCGVALFTVALAGQARADQEISLDYWKSTSSFDSELWGGWATCQGVPIPWNCTNASDYVGYWVWESWSQGYSYVGLGGAQVSPGDIGFVQIAQWCDDGSFGDNNRTGSGPDGGSPPDYAESYCFTADGNFGTAYKVTFTYGVENKNAS